MGASGSDPSGTDTPSREKVHFYGTLDLGSGREIAMRSEVMNAGATAQHLEQILQAIPDAPILFLWDRAPWHSGPPIIEVLVANPRLEIMRFPAVAPDLNPQEHVWKATRRVVSHNHTVPRLPELTHRFQEHLSATTFESSFLDSYGFNDVCSMFE